MLSFKIQCNGSEFDIQEQADGRFHGTVDGNLFYDFTLNEEPWTDELKSIMKAIKEAQKEAKKAQESALSAKIQSLGEEAGTRDYRFRMDNRLYYALKSKGVNVTQFINLAIAEKLEVME